MLNFGEYPFHALGCISLCSPSGTASCRLRPLVLNEGIDTISTDPSMGPDGKGECHDEHLPDEDPARYRRVQRSRAGRLEGRGTGPKDRLRVARGARRSGAQLPPGTLGYDRKLYEHIEEESRERLRKQSWRVKVAGAPVAGTHLRMGAVDLEIVALAEELQADLIVMGSRGLGGVRRALMGSVSDSVVRHAHCPVLVVRPEKGQAA